MATQPEVWLRGPIPGIHASLLPAAHALQQTLEDVERVLGDLPAGQIWSMPGGAASVGFHVRHLAGSIDRLLTYARGEGLTDDQRRRLAEEKSLPRTEAAELLADLRRAVDRGMAQLRATPADTLGEARAVGRAALPTTVLGLIFHAAEHAQRHAGQIVTTARIVRALGSLA
jgi:uncharacterized damage-inducible protein DinB